MKFPFFEKYSSINIEDLCKKLIDYYQSIKEKERMKKEEDIRKRREYILSSENTTRLKNIISKRLYYISDDELLDGYIEFNPSLKVTKNVLDWLYESGYEVEYSLYEHRYDIPIYKIRLIYFQK